MNKLKSIIIEDELLAAELLESYISKTPQLQLAGAFYDPVKALAFMNEQRTDVLFLDLHLPKIRGFELINLLPYSPQIIITTAFHNYGVESYEYEVVDYLLKPIEFERFLKAVNRLKKSDFEKEKVTAINDEYAFFNVNKKKIKVFYKDILFLESRKGYVKIYLSDGNEFMTKINISRMESLLSDEFIRIHKSFIVQLNKINSFSATKVEIDDRILPIGRMYQKKAIRQFELSCHA